MPSVSSTSAPVRVAYAVAGWCAVGLAAAGLLLPGLPGTVFLLVAWYCFSKSSPRSSRWLHDHPWLGPSLRRHLTGGGMSKSAKRAALAAMWTSILISAGLLIGVHRAAAIGVVALGLLGTLAIVRRVPTTPAAGAP
jgi:uncharacterized membrane protein YbaN (DUF454 family)